MMSEVKKIAKNNEINTIGTLGVLLSAKQAGLLTEIKPKLEAIKANRVYLSQSVINRVLELVLETD